MIISTTLTGSNAGIIGDAIASVVEHVDRCLVIDTGAQDDRSRSRGGSPATSCCCASSLEERLFRRPEFRTAGGGRGGRTAGLSRWTPTKGCSSSRGFDLRAALQRVRADVLLVSDDGGTYAKERIVRLPAGVRWSGPTHECWKARRGSFGHVLAGVRFRELPKDPAVLKRKFERDIAILKKYTRQHGRQPRWFYYLGSSHQDLGEYAAAIDAYRTCAELRGWAEEGAWACYRAAKCCGKLGRWGEAVHLCAAGLAIRPATAELAWLAGFAAFKAQRHDDAIAWSRMAVANGLLRGQAAQFERISFRHPPALYEGPYDVLRWT